MTMAGESWAAHPAHPAHLARRLNGLRRLFARLLRQCVRVERSGKRLNLVFGAGTSAPPVSLSEAPARGRTQARDDLPQPSDADLARMRGDLADMLDFHPTTRSVFPSLVLVERALGRRKGRALDRLPGEVLTNASVLLARLAGDWSAEGLCLLQARLKLLRAGQPEPDDAANGGGSPQVEEGSLSMFMELDREWEQQLRPFPPVAPGGSGDSSATT